MIANNMFFPINLAIIHWKKGLVSLPFSVLHWVLAFLCEFNACFFYVSLIDCFRENHFYVSLIDCFRENQCLFSKHCFRQS